MNYILKYIQIENSYFKLFHNITVLLYLWSNKSSLIEYKPLSETIKILIILRFWLCIFFPMFMTLAFRSCGPLQSESKISHKIDVPAIIAN